MSRSEAELSLILKARNLANREVAGFRGLLEKAKSSAKGFGSALLTVGKAAAVGFAAVVAGLALAGPKIMDMAVELELMGNKAKIVFGDQLDSVKGWAKANAAAMGLTQTKAVGLAASFADLLVPMGFTRKEAAKMSTDVVGLSGALSEWSGGTQSAAEVSDVLAKAMLGERDGLKALGISITEADIKQRLLKNGTSELTGAALEQAKAIATQELIFEKSQDAQTAYAKGSDSLARKQALLRAKFGELVEKVVNGLAPALTTLMTWVMETAVPAAEAFIAKIQKWVRENQPLISQIRGFISNVLNVLVTVLGTIIGALSKVFAWIGNVARAISGNKTVMRVFAGLWDSIAAAVGQVIYNVKLLIEWVKRAIDLIGQLSTPTIPKSQSQYNFTPHHEGGWVGLNGPEVGMLGEKGPEYIVPNDKLGALGKSENGVRIVGISKREIERMIDEGLYFRLQRAVPV